MRSFFVAIIFVCVITSCTNHPDQVAVKNSGVEKEKTAICDDDCMAKSKSGELSCKLTTAELRERRETVIASLKRQLLEKKELKNGYAFRFPGDDKMVDELASFIKSERTCCDFFTFTFSVSGDKSEAWLQLSGPEGVKEFIGTELGM